jgi:hypothetical protein
MGLQSRESSILFVLFVGNCFCIDDLPHVHITKPNFGELFPGNETEVDLIKGLEIQCTAPYPVEWVLEKFDFGKV